jgi:hypothetical protein
MAVIVITFIEEFVKIGQLVQKVEMGTHRQHGDLIERKVG